MEGSNPLELTRVGNVVFFLADDGATGRELWKTDGTTTGTVQVRDIEPGAAGSDGVLSSPAGKHTAALPRDWRSGDRVVAIGRHRLGDVLSLQRGHRLRGRRRPRRTTVRIRWRRPRALANEWHRAGDAAGEPDRATSRHRRQSARIVRRDERHAVLQRRRWSHGKRALEKQRYRCRNRAGQGHLCRPGLRPRGFGQTPGSSESPVLPRQRRSRGWRAVDQ